MKLHPLHNPDAIMMYMRSTGEYFPQARATGRSTALALEVISTAIRNPGRWFDIVDHHNTLAAHKELSLKVRRIVECLGLQHFVFQQATVCFGVPCSPRVYPCPA